MRLTTRRSTTSPRLAAVLLALCLSAFLVGCGGDDSGSDDSSDSADSSESSDPEPSETESESESPSEEPSEDTDSGGSSDAEVQAFIVGCKRGVDQQISQGNVPEKLREDMEAVCESATSVEKDEVDRITLETCVVVASGTSDLSEDDARSACQEQLS